jgi:hypothetical protein
MPAQVPKGLDYVKSIPFILKAVEILSIKHLARFN